MRTAEERILLVHRRTLEIKNKVIRRRLLVSGAVSAAVFFLLIWAVKLAGDYAGGSIGSISSGYTASSMLNENTGSYVLVAVLAFMAGVALTATVKKWLENRKGPGGGGDSHDP